MEAVWRRIVQVNYHTQENTVCKVILNNYIAIVLKTYIFSVILLYLIIELGTCEDGIENELEEGTDCGGPDCPACGEFPVRSGSAKN